MSLAVLLDLLETSQSCISRTALFERHGAIAGSLVGVGALVPGATRESVRCRSCDTGHAAEVEYDAARRQHFHFCHQAGRVAVNDDDLITYRADVNWLLGQLERAIPVTGSGRCELMRERVWYLGEAITGATAWAVVFARQCWTMARFDELAERLSHVLGHPTGIVLSTGHDRMPNIALPRQFHSIALSTIADLSDDRLVVNQVQLWRTLQDLARGTGRAKRAGGRAADKREWILRAVRDLRRGGVRFASKSEAARELRQRWRRAYPDVEPPGASTIRGLLSEDDVT